jgi:hypothetical protein
VLKLQYLRWVLFPIKGDTYLTHGGVIQRGITPPSRHHMAATPSTWSSVN